MTLGESGKRIEDLFDQVWETLDLPKPRLRRFTSPAQWARWDEWEAYRRRHGGLGTQWFLGEFLRRQDQPPAGAMPEIDARLRRWMELESQTRPEALPAFSEVAALRALDFLREIEDRCLETREEEQLVVCLMVQAVLLGRALGRVEEAEQRFEEVWGLGEGKDGWRVRAMAEQVLHFLNGEGPAGDYLDFFRGV